MLYMFYIYKLIKIMSTLMNQEAVILKLVLMGEGGVGKTSLLSCYCDGTLVVPG